MLRITAIALFIGALIFLAQPSQGMDTVKSTIHLKDGSKVEGIIIKEHTDSVIVTVDGRNKSVDKVDIVRIVREDNYESTLTEGYKLESEGKFYKAMDQYHKILTKDPEHADAMAGKKRMLQAIPFEFKKRNAHLYTPLTYDKVLQNMYNEISGMPADSPQREAMKIVESEVYTYMGQDKMKRLVYEQAEADFRRALRLNPENFTAALMLGDLMTATGKWEEAYKLLQDVVVLMPDNLIAKGLLMQAAFRTKNTEHGMQIYTALSDMKEVSPQEKKFIDLCFNDCKDFIAAASGGNPSTANDDAGTTGTEPRKPSGETSDADKITTP